MEHQLKIFEGQIRVDFFYHQDPEPTFTCKVYTPDHLDDLEPHVREAIELMTKFGDVDGPDHHEIKYIFRIDGGSGHWRLKKRVGDSLMLEKMKNEPHPEHPHLVDLSKFDKEATPKMILFFEVLAQEVYEHFKRDQPLSIDQGIQETVVVYIFNFLLENHSGDILDFVHENLDNHHKNVHIEIYNDSEDAEVVERAEKKT